MHATVLTIFPGRLSGYAIVHGSTVHDAGSRHLLHEVKVTGPRATPAADLGGLMERRLTSLVESMALSHEALDAVVIGSAVGRQGDVDVEALVAAAERGALLAKTWYLVVPADGWRTLRVDRHEPVDILAAAREAVAASRSPKVRVPDVASAEAAMMGMYASRHLGIPVLAAMPGEGPPD